MQQLTIEVYGRVQSVGFRSFVKSKADTLGITGYVMNRADGSMFILAQGGKEVLDQLLKIVHKGPTFSKVERVSFFWKEPSNNYRKFIIALERGTLNDQTQSFINLGKRLLGFKNKVPQHVAVIPDGNRRWARELGLELTKGHEKAASFENLIPLIDEAKNIGIKYITFWAFSTENWNRSKQEVEYLLKLVEISSNEFKEYFQKNGIRLRYLGRKDRLPQKVVESIEKTEAETEKYDKLYVQICVDYGGRDELIRAINKMLKKGLQEISEDDLAHYLDSSGIPDPDLIIRTSGEQRTSGFMSFQSAYSEFYFTNVHYPDFGPQELRKAVAEFSRRRRNFGK